MWSNVTDNPLQRYVDWFESLSLSSPDDLHTIMTNDVHFSDPFNSVTGLDDTRKIFEDMFNMLDSTRFRITHAAMAESEPPAALLRWEMDAVSRKSKEPIRIVGMSEVYFSDDGRVRVHIDHWDAGRQFYEKLPLIGWLVRTIRSRMAA